MSTVTQPERVVLLDDAGQAIGTAEKATVHHGATPLHLAFSCYLFDPSGRVLVSRRALSKRTWPGVWTNSYCGHPSPDESPVDAVRRRGREELGVSIDALECVLPDFRYVATASDGTVENEVCPVFFAYTTDQIVANADEVMDWRWVPWTELKAAAQVEWSISPWAIAQVPQLDSVPLLTSYTRRP